MQLCLSVCLPSVSFFLSFSLSPCPPPPCVCVCLCVCGGLCAHTCVRACVPVQIHGLCHLISVTLASLNLHLGELSAPLSVTAFYVVGKAWGILGFMFLSCLEIIDLCVHSMDDCFIFSSDCNYLPEDRFCSSYSIIARR